MKFAVQMLLYFLMTGIFAKTTCMDFPVLKICQLKVKLNEGHE